MLSLTRPMPVIGGASDIWGYNNPAWDTMVEGMVVIARGVGVPAITGEAYLRRLELKRGDVHALKTADNQAVYLDVFGELRSAAYAIVPKGSVERQAQRERLQALASSEAIALAEASQDAEDLLANAGRPPGSPSDIPSPPIRVLSDVPRTPPTRPPQKGVHPPPPPPPQLAQGPPAKAGAPYATPMWVAVGYLRRHGPQSLQLRSPRRQAAHQHFR